MARDYKYISRKSCKFCVSQPLRDSELRRIKEELKERESKEEKKKGIISLFKKVFKE